MDEDRAGKQEAPKHSDNWIWLKGGVIYSVTLAKTSIVVL